MMLRSLDVFSGIGGLTLALEGAAQPVGYCEADPKCQRVLEARMDDGQLPRAPIYEDVCTLSVQRDYVDLIVAGWPCQDLSNIGQRAGLEGARSGLVRELFRLTDELRPCALFLENVPTVLSKAMPVLIEEFVNKRGYDLRWVVMPASAVGAPHLRNRWFGLALRPSVRLPLASGPSLPCEWAREPVPRLVVPDSRAQRKGCYRRFEMLGNSVVPAQARAAYNFLVNLGGPTGTGGLYAHRNSMLFPKCGVAMPRGAVMAPLWLTRWARPIVYLTLDPALYQNMEALRNEVKNPLVQQAVRVRAWPTPRHRGFGPASHALTKRSIKDLPTVIRYERGTPDALRRAGVINPEWAEWLMGFPRGWSLEGFAPQSPPSEDS